MKLAELRDRLERDGTDVSTWSEPYRAAAEHLLAIDSTARTILAQGQRLERLIAAAMRPDTPARAESVERVLDALEHPLPPQRRRLLFHVWPAALLDVDLAPARWRLAALAGVAVLGVVSGLVGADIDAAEGSVAVASSETGLAQVFEPEPLTGVRP
jgi:hypothetical protein